MLSGPIVLIVLVGAALLLGVVPGLALAGPAGAAALSPEERERIAADNARRIVDVTAPIPNTQIARGYQYGALVGGTLSMIPGIWLGAWLGPIGLAAGVGVGYVLSVTGNDTLGARVEFAKRLGFAGLDDRPAFSVFGIPNPAKPGLFSALSAIGRDDLVNTARNVIGMQDDRANRAWMEAVIVALLDSGYVVNTP